ncbi:UNVERIFIED_CONTAM: hypothetical protein GTU68_011609 [Idotea baltica]|nr:hypothetical protein [Idotea baltica]
MALNEPGDLISVDFSDDNEVKIIDIIGDGGKLSRKAKLNTASIPIISMLKAINSAKGIDVLIDKRMPLGSGMGSSAASAVAGAVAANELLGNPFSKQELIPFILEGEAFASGSVHGDNAIPSLMGGIVLTLAYEPLRLVELPVPSFLHYAMVHPDLKILTKEARGILPAQVPMQTAIKQMGLLSGFVAGLYTEDEQLIGDSLHDLLAEPYRKTLLTGFDAVKKTALAEGAINCGISGSGPSVYALTNSAEKAERIAKGMETTFNTQKINAQSYWGKVNNQGAKIIA